MPSDVVLRLIGESEAIPTTRSVASQWFSELGDEARDVLASGRVKHLEIEAAALEVQDGPGMDKSTARYATWEEYKAGAEGEWTTVHFEGVPFTCYSIYARHSAAFVGDELADHISDHKTHQEAEVQANALAVLLGVRVVDFSIATGTAFESYGNKFIASLVNKALKPYLKLTFLDGEKESIQVKLEWERNVYVKSSSTHPGLVAKPTKQQLMQIGGPIGGQSGGEFAMEVINSARYEGGERSGLLNDDPEDARSTAEETPDLYYRPLKFEFCNEGEPPISAYQ